MLQMSTITKICSELNKFTTLRLTCIAIYAKLSKSHFPNSEELKDRYNEVDMLLESVESLNNDNSLMKDIWVSLGCFSYIFPVKLNFQFLR